MRLADNLNFLANQRIATESQWRQQLGFIAK